MKTRILAAALPLFVASIALGQATPASSAFTYQGQLKVAGQPASGVFDFRFQLADAPTLGLLLGTVDVGDVAVTDGLFTVQLDFGATPFARDARWLAIGVRDGASGGSYTSLTPRQPLTVAPFAQYALAGGFWTEGTSGITNTNSAGFVGVNRATRVSSAEFFGVQAPVTADNAYGGMYIATDGPNSLPFYGYRAGTANTAWTYLDGDTDRWYVNNGGNRITVEGDTGDVGIGIDNPIARLHVDGGARYTGGGIIIDGPYGAAGRSLNVYTINTESAVYSWNDGTGNASTFRSRQGHAVDAEIISSSGNAINALTNGTGRAGRFEVDNASNSTSGLFATHNGTGNAFAATNTGTGRAGFFQVSNASSSANALYCTTSGTGYALLADGRARCDVLEIAGGSDLSEGFEINGGAQPGQVVVIDAANPGQLKASTTAYDKKVAGVVSGAGGIKTGMVMGQEGSIAHGKHPVALTGRVYVWCDASAGPIEPGDLLTTSDVPGHAMKATDDSRAHGATIGKAMTGLPSGRGLVLVLVNLQ